MNFNLILLYCSNMLFVFLTAFLQVFDELCETLFVMEATGNLPNPSLTGAFS